MKSIIQEEILKYKTNVIKNAISMGYTDNQQLSKVVELPVKDVIEIRKKLILNEK